MGQCSKTHPMKRTWDINRHTFYLSMGASISSTPSPTGHITKEMPEFCNKFNIAWCSVSISKL